MTPPSREAERFVFWVAAGFAGAPVGVVDQAIAARAKAMRMRNKRARVPHEQWRRLVLDVSQDPLTHPALVALCAAALAHE